MDRPRELFNRLKSGGEAAIDLLIGTRKSEELFLDFKLSANGGAGERLHGEDRSALAKAISGFGNSEGGIIVWGVRCKSDKKLGDVASAKVPIENPTRFVSWLEGAVSGCTVPVHNLVQHFAISDAGASAGFAVTYIPRGPFAPHQCLVDEYKYRYFIRAGSNFEHIPHAILAGMFGRYPQPVIFHTWDNLGGSVTTETSSFYVGGETLPSGVISAAVVFVVRNQGYSSARDVFANVSITSLPGSECRYIIGGAGAGNTFLRHESSAGTHFVAIDQFKLAPWASVRLCEIRVTLVPPFSRPMSYEITFGCAGSPVRLVAGSAVPEAVAGAVRTFSEVSPAVQRPSMSTVVFDLERVQSYYEDFDSEERASSKST